MAVLFLMACGPSFDWNQFTSYFQPETANLVNKKDRSFDYTPDVLFEDYALEETGIDTDSVQIIAEWSKQFKDQNAASIAALLYNSEPQSALEKNEDVQHFISIQKDINAYTFDEYTEQPQLKVKPNTDLYLQHFQAAKSTFMKERIGYQIMRAMAVSGNHKGVLAFYKKDFLPIATKSIVATKAHARNAGSMIFEGNKAQAFYEFAQIFDKNDSQRALADLSVRTNQVSYSDEALSFCKSAHEKAAVYVLASIQPNQDALGFIEKIVAIEPQNPMLEFLMAREINRNEFQYFSKNDAEMKTELSYSENTKDLDQAADKAKSYFGKLANLGESTAKLKIASPAFWLVAASHCQYLDGNYAKARTLLNEAIALKPQKIELQDQLVLQDVLLFPIENPVINTESEAKILPLIEKLNLRKNHRQTMALAGTLKVLSKLYKGVSAKKIKSSGWFSSCSNDDSKAVSHTASGMPFANAKSLLFAYLSTSEFDKKDEYGYPLNYYQSLQDFGNLEDTTSAFVAEELVRFAAQSSPSAIDQTLLKLIDKEKLKEVLARRLLAEQQYTKAAEAFKAVKPEIWNQDKYSLEFNKNPFSLKIDHSSLADTGTKYTPFSFSQKMAELTTKTDAESLYWLGCGAYNLSYFGNSWVLVRNSRSNDELAKNIGYYVNPFRNLKSDYYQLNTAQNYFEKALKGTTDRELQAKIYYGLALIERNRFEFEYAQDEPEYNFEDDDASNTKNKLFQAKMAEKRKSTFSNFTVLKNQYANTQFQAMLLKECSTYEQFVRGK
jgi:hypothetical protein